MGEAPFGHDRAAAADDAGCSLRSHRNVWQTDARVDREIINPLLGLFDQRVTVNFPRQILGLTIHSFKRLIDWHRADRHG